MKGVYQQCDLLYMILLIYRFEDLMNNAPLPEYTRRNGWRNLVSRYSLAATHE